MKIGDYVRTKHGCIGIYTEKEEIERVLDWHGGWKDKKILYQLINGSKFFEDEIIKSSPNIIDLIEVGDYVNGYYVEDVRDVFDGEDTYTRICLASGCNYFQPDITEKEDIKSIVTKEQFESMEYKL